LGCYIADIFSFVIVALATTLPHIATLEAELKTSMEALKDANAARVSTEKATKSAETRAKKAEKALADASQKQIKREKSVVERLDEISTSVGSKCFILPLDIC
jgi:Skp family chaperone for outer membrane proteins